MNGLSDTERLVVDHLQEGFPLVARPFEAAGRALGLDENRLITTLQALLSRRVLTRFGPLVQVERLGGAFVLAALSVPEPRYEAVAAQVNALPAVAHNYRREHALNMWFVLATEQPEGIGEAIATIERHTALPVYAFPKEREYFVGMRFTVGGTAPVGQGRHRPLAQPCPLETADRALVRAVQAGLPLLPAPYAEVARLTGLEESVVLTRLSRLLDSGVFRRIGAVPNHYAIGYTANGMAVFDVEEGAVDRLGEALGAMPAVSHCYRRPRRLPLWRYNLFAMLHGDSREAVCAEVARLRTGMGEACRDHAVLFSSRILKKTGLRI